jgi:hypothetical protein
MLLSWKEGQRKDIDKTVTKFGNKYHDLFIRSDKIGIGIDDEIALYQEANVEIMRQLNPSIDGWESFLRDYGPLSITVDANPPYGGTIHAILVTGMYGKKDASHTQISYIDPLDGKEYLIDFMKFVAMYEGPYSVDWQIQVIHLPKQHE